MLLGLSRIRTAQERYEGVFGPEAFTNDRDGFQVIGPVSLAFDIFKDKAQFRLVGAVQATLTTTVEIEGSDKPAAVAESIRCFESRAACSASN